MRTVRVDAHRNSSTSGRDSSAHLRGVAQPGKVSAGRPPEGHDGEVTAGSGTGIVLGLADRVGGEHAGEVAAAMKPMTPTSREPTARPWG